MLIFEVMRWMPSNIVHVDGNAEELAKSGSINAPLLAGIDIEDPSTPSQRPNVTESKLPAIVMDIGADGLNDVSCQVRTIVCRHDNPRRSG